MRVTIYDNEYYPFYFVEIATKDAKKVYNIPDIMYYNYMSIKNALHGMECLIEEQMEKQDAERKK